MTHDKNYKNKYLVMTLLTIGPILMTIFLNLGIYLSDVSRYILPVTIYISIAFYIITIVLCFVKKNIRWFDRTYAFVWSFLFLLYTYVIDIYAEGFGVRSSKIYSTDTFFITKLVGTNLSSNEIQLTEYWFSFISFFTILSIVLVIILWVINSIKVKKLEK